MPALRGESWKIFENQAISSWQLAIGQARSRYARTASSGDDFEARRSSTPPSQNRAGRGPGFAPRSFQGVATLCRPDSKNEKTRLKLSLIEALKNGKKGLRPFGHRSVEVRFDFCFQQNAYGGWVYG